MRTLIINTLLEVVLLFLTNLVLADDIPINLLSVIICAIGLIDGITRQLDPDLDTISIVARYAQEA